MPKVGERDDNAKRGSMSLFLRYSNCLLFLVLNCADADTVPVRFIKHITYSLSFGCDSLRVNSIFFNQHHFNSLCTLIRNAFIDFDTAFRRSITGNDHFGVFVIFQICGYTFYIRFLRTVNDSFSLTECHDRFQCLLSVRHNLQLRRLVYKLIQCFF